MKSNIFLVLVFLLIAGGIWMFTKENKSETSEVTAINQQLVTDNTSVKSHVKKQENKDIPAIEWKDALIGTWKFTTARKSPKALHQLTGEAEYLANGTFIKHVTHKYYIPRFHDYVIDPSGNNKLAIVAGGSIKGSWKVSPEKGVWVETIASCNINPSFTLKDRREHKGYSTCQRDFNGANQYGTYTTEKTKFTLNQFRNEAIKITGTFFNEGSDVTHLMWKPKK